MIDELRIRNLGVIEAAELSLDTGMTAITGETGAGKTMALTSLALLMGAKADSAKVRAGADMATVEGTFLVAADSPVIEIVQNAGGAVDETDDGVAIVVARHVPKTGRSRAYAGGQSVPQATLQQMADHLVTVHGQSDQLRLKSPSRQREALDRFGGEALARAREDYAQAWDVFIAATQELEDFEKQAKQAGTERLALEALVTRVDAVKPVDGEEDELRAQALRLDNVEALRAAMASARGSLDHGEASALTQLDSAYRELEKASTADPNLGVLAAQLKEVALVTSDIANQVGELLGDLDADPERLNAIHERRAQLTALQRELGMDIPEIIKRRAQADARLASISDPAAHMDKLRTQVADAKTHLLDVGTTLSKHRAAVGQRLSKSVTSELQALAMKDATFSVDLSRRETPAVHGLDDVSFLLAPHRGSDLLPLGSTASGGEMSRIMLALEVTLSGANPEADHTFIFDEVDAGIGGKTALSVGERLATLGQKCQILVVTHLAQVAAYASAHVVVEKQSSTAATNTGVVAVAQEDRERELARMLSGHEDSEAARTHAAELLRSAHMGL